MALVETEIYSLLTGNATITRKLNKRVYPVVMPQDPVLPAITYQRISGEKINILGGYSGLENPHIVINVWSQKYEEAKAIAEDVHSAMNGASAFKSWLINDLDGYDPDISLFVVSMDYSCWDNEV